MQSEEEFKIFTRKAFIKHQEIIEKLKGQQNILKRDLQVLKDSIRELKIYFKGLQMIVAEHLEKEGERVK